MFRYFKSLFLLVLLVSIAGCSSQYRINRKAINQPSAWPFYHGDLSASGAVAEGDFNGQLNILWENGTGGKPAGPMTIYNSTLIFPESKKKIRYYDINTGQLSW